MDQPATDPTAWPLFTESAPLIRPTLLAQPALSAQSAVPFPGLAQPGRVRAGPSRPGPGASVIVLADPPSGGERLGALLAGNPALACTAGTGILELCEQAANTWRGAERTGSTLSALGAASVRAMAGTMLATIKSQQGAQRWCETFAGPPRSTGTFLQLYPATKIICLHRGCLGYLGCLAAGDGRPCPAADAAGDELAAATDRWRARTEALLELERDRPGRCLRVRYEDLAAYPDAAAGVLAFLGLDHDAGGQDHRRAAESGPPGPSPPVAALPGRWSSGAWPLGRWAGAALLGEINRLHAELGYPPIAAA